MENHLQRVVLAPMQRRHKTVTSNPKGNSVPIGINFSAEI
jgi:hypothetical protein